MRVITQGGIAFNFTMTSGKKSCRLNFEAEVLRTMESMCFVYKKLIYLQIKKYSYGLIPSAQKYYLQSKTWCRKTKRQAMHKNTVKPA